MELKEFIITHFKEVKKIDYIFNEDNESIIQKLQLIDLNNHNKGILIIGNTGCGKTALIKLFNLYNKSLQKRKINVVNVRQICFDFQIGGYKEIEIYLRNENKINTIVCLDDLGTENDKINYYGTVEDIVSDIMYLRHDNSALTFATTNLSVTSLEKRYGKRLFDRFKQMFEICYLKGNSLRK